MDNLIVHTTIPQLRFPEFANDGEWGVKRLGEISTSFSGGTPSASNKDYYGGTIPFIRSGEINSDHTEIFLTQEGLDNSSAKMVEKGTILYALYGATSGEVGIARLKGAINQAILAIIPNEGFDSLFIYHYLKSQKESIVNHYLQGGQGNLSGAIINALMIPVPPFYEQRRIAACLSALEQKLSATDGKLKQLKAYKKGLMQKLFPAKGKKLPELRFKEFEKDGEWEEKKLGEFLFEHKMKSDGHCQVYSVSVSKGVINQIEYLGRSFSASDTSNYKLVKPYDIIYTKSPTGIFPFGIVKQSFVNHNVIVSPLYGVFSPVNQYIGYIIHSYFESPERTNNYLAPIVQKGAKNTIQITNEIFLSQSVCFPSKFEEQCKIADCLTSIDNMINQYTNEVALLELYKKGLMQQMFPTSK